MHENDVLTTYLENMTAAASTQEIWGDAIMLTCTAYVTDQLPPLNYVSSVRGVVTKDDALLVITDPDGSDHIVPGGRVENGESVLETLEREILEETGWTISNPVLLGVLHFRHLKPKPPDYRYPYPDFLHLIYRAEAATHLPGRMVPDAYVSSIRFVPLVQASTLALPATQVPFLHAVIENMRAV